MPDTYLSTDPSAGTSVPAGLLAGGTIDLANRPHVKNPDGSISTVRSKSFNIDGKEVLIPTVVGDRVVSDKEALAAYRRTGQHLGIFDSPEHATSYAKAVHDNQSAQLDGYLSTDPNAGEPVPAEPAPDFHVDVKASDGAVDMPWTQIIETASNLAGAPIPKDVSDLVIGGAKKAGQTAARLGDLAEHFPVIGHILRAANQYLFGLTPEQQQAAFTAADAALQPKNMAQKVGGALEQIGEVVLPGGAIEHAGTAAATKLAPMLERVLPETAARVLPKVAVEAGANAGIATAQGGNPVVGAVVGGAAPVVGEVGDTLAENLKASAGKQVMQALGPTKERFKAIAERLTPEILKRGLRGSREGLLKKAETALEDSGDQLDHALAVFGDQPVSVEPITRAIETAKDAFRTSKTMSVQDAMLKGYVKLKNSTVQLTSSRATLLPNGMVDVAIDLEPRAIQQLSKLQKTIEDVGPISDVSQLRAIRKTWDDVVAQAGGYAHRAGGAIGVPLRDQSEAFAKREGATAIRKLLAEEVPQIADINKEYSFWKNLSDVLTQTTKRTQPQQQSLGGQVAEVAGSAAASHAGVGAAVGLGKVTKLAQRAFTSPRWRLASAQTKDRLADAIMDGDLVQMTSALSRIAAVEGSKLATSEK